MIRTIQCKDKDGNIFNLKGLSNLEISKFEILLPENYMMVYSGAEMAHNDKHSQDFSLKTIQCDNFLNHITIINRNPIYIDKSQFRPIRWKSAEEDIEALKFLVSISTVIHIIFNNDHTLNQVIYVYQFDDGFDDDIELIAPVENSKYYLMKEKY